MGLLQLFQPTNLLQNGGRLRWQATEAIALDFNGRVSASRDNAPLPGFGNPTLAGDGGWRVLGTELDLLARWEKVMGVRETITKAIEEVRKTGAVGSSLEARIVLRTSDGEMRKFLESSLHLWPQVAIVSEAAVEFDPAAPALEVGVSKAEGSKCPRCWQWRRDIGSETAHPDICGRCARALAK